MIVDILNLDFKVVYRNIYQIVYIYYVMFIMLSTNLTKISAGHNEDASYF